MLTLKMVRDQLCDNGGAYPYTMVDVCGHSVSVKEDFLGVRAGPDKAEVSGSSPLRPTLEHLVTGNSVPVTSHDEPDLLVNLLVYGSH